MKKTDIDLIRVVLQRNSVAEPTVAAVIEEIKQEEAVNKKGKVPAPKKEWVIVQLPKPAGMAFIVQIGEGEDCGEVIGKIEEGRHEFNETKKGRRLPIKNISQAFESLSNKFLKDKKVWIRTKEPVQIVKGN